MNPPLERPFVLLQKAKDDCYVLNRLSGDEQAPAWAVGFHAQQAVEKSLKAVLDFHGINFPFTHDISRLDEMLENANLPHPPDAPQLEMLTPYGVSLKYEYEPVGISYVINRSKITQLALQTVAWAESILTEKHT
ncbi:TPA: hypothetical protein DDW35_07120 [Candidatus Sumerlaeota bacterium]|nr:hypothetical protein [Candidatus Sumerlaeota bacterium]